MELNRKWPGLVFVPKWNLDLRRLKGKSGRRNWFLIRNLRHWSKAAHGWKWILHEGNCHRATVQLQWCKRHNRLAGGGKLLVNKGRCWTKQQRHPRGRPLKALAEPVAHNFNTFRQCRPLRKWPPLIWLWGTLDEGNNEVSYMRLNWRGTASEKFNWRPVAPTWFKGISSKIGLIPFFLRAICSFWRQSYAPCVPFSPLS
jgi:hypothetical protein